MALNSVQILSPNINETIIDYTDRSVYEYKYKLPYAWGLFEIKKGGRIKIEKWFGKEWADYGIFKIPGYVLNDTTLLLDHPSVGRDTFYFHYLPVKPDSTNRFIKPSLKK